MDSTTHKPQNQISAQRVRQPTPTQRLNQLVIKSALTVQQKVQDVEVEEGRVRRDGDRH